MQSEEQKCNDTENTWGFTNKIQAYTINRRMFINRLIIVCSIIALTLGGVILWPWVSSQFFTPDPSALPKEFRQAVEAFGKTTIKKSLYPDTLSFTLQEKATADRGDVYITNWNKDGTFFSFLVGLTKNNKAINYQRVWTMPRAEPVDAEIAQKYFQSVFDEAYLTQLGTISCKSTPTEKGVKVTECGIMKTDSAGNLMGVTVRTPVLLAPPTNETPPAGVIPPEITTISACFVPKEGTPAYLSSLCI